MKSSYNKKPSSVIELEMELSKDEFDNYWQAAYNQALTTAAVKGFRQGAAPKELADKVIDKEKVFNTAVQEAVRVSLNEMVQKNEWTLIDKPQVDIISGSDGLKYRSQLVVFPEVKLGDYKKIAADILDESVSRIKELKVTDEEIDKSLEWLLNSRAKLVIVNREARNGDVVKIDLESFVEGNPLNDGKVKGDQFILGKGRFLPGFEEKIVSHKAGDQINFSLLVPSDYWQKDLRDKKIDFKVFVGAVFERILPELDDKFAGSIGKFNTLADLRKNIKTGLLNEKQQKEKEITRIKILEKIVSDAEVDVPQIMIDKTLENLLEENKTSQGSRGQMEVGAERSLKEIARKRIISSLVIRKIAQQEHLEPTEEEIKTEVGRYQHNKAILDTHKFYDYIYDVLQNGKVFRFLEKQS